MSPTLIGNATKERLFAAGIALQRTPSAAPPSPLSFGTLGGAGTTDPKESMVSVHGNAITFMRYAMNPLRSGVGLILWVLVSAFPFPVAAQQEDEAAIREVQAQQAAAWNHHDGAAYARLFTDDGDVVNVVGWWWRGRSEIERKLTAGFVFVFAQSTLSITDVHVRFLTPTTAIAHVRWTMVGAKTPPGIPEPREGIQLQILTKQANRWLIASFQNTNSVSEMPFARGPTIPATPKP